MWMGSSMATLDVIWQATISTELGKVPLNQFILKFISLRSSCKSCKIGKASHFASICILTVNSLAHLLTAVCNPKKGGSSLEC